MEPGATRKTAHRRGLVKGPSRFHYARTPGGAEGSRTPDLLIANEALYRLSYGPGRRHGAGFTSKAGAIWSGGGRLSRKAPPLSYRRLRGGMGAKEAGRVPALRIQ